MTNFSPTYLKCNSFSSIKKEILIYSIQNKSESINMCIKNTNTEMNQSSASHWIYKWQTSCHRLEYSETFSTFEDFLLTITSIYKIGIRDMTSIGVFIQSDYLTAPFLCRSSLALKVRILHLSLFPDAFSFVYAMVVRVKCREGCLEFELYELLKW